MVQICVKEMRSMYVLRHDYLLLYSQERILCIYPFHEKYSFYLCIYQGAPPQFFLPCIPRFSLDYECVLLSYKYKYFNINCYSEWVSEWLLLFDPIWAIFQLYHVENVGRLWYPLCTIPTRLVGFFVRARTLKQQ